MWTRENIPDLSGKTALITGANTGIGYQTALALYNKGANVVLGCRNIEKANAAAEKLSQSEGLGMVSILPLDLSDLDAVGQSASTFLSQHKQLDLLVNNAGVMTPPAIKTKQGFELQFGTNVLGHFALTALLYPLLKSTSNARIITVSSLVYRLGKIDYGNLMLEKDYDGGREYAQSKLGNLFFTLELQRRIIKKNDDLLSVASHPGITQTELSRNMSAAEINSMIDAYGALMEDWQGALPSLYAATSNEIKGGEFIGPDGDGGLRGFPAKADILPLALDEAQALRLWEYAEKATGISFL